MQNSSTKKLRVLVVDDNEASAKTLGWGMELFGHEVRLAGTGLEAINIAKEFIPDAVLLDIGLPDMNGYEVCEAIRKEPGLQKTTFIAQTGWTKEQNKFKSENVSFDHYIVKPVDIATLGLLLTSCSLDK